MTDSNFEKQTECCYVEMEETFTFLSRSERSSCSWSSGWLPAPHNPERERERERPSDMFYQSKTHQSRGILKLCWRLMVVLLATICPTCRYHTNWIWSADLHCKCFVTQSINFSIYCYQTLFVDSYCRKFEYFSMSTLDKQKHLEDQRRSHVREARMCPYGTAFWQQDSATKCASTCTATNLTIAGVNIYKENYRGRRQCGSHKVSVFRM